MKIGVIIVAAFCLQAFEVRAQDLPFCQAELNNEFNEVIAKNEWREDLFIGAIEGATQTVLISTSVGNDKIMSLWVREKTPSRPNGLFSFVDLSSGRKQYSRFYMADGFSVGVTCQLTEK
ncbi:MAG: hypothetical protein AB7O96_06685 [Pseudobdellovibrionaceae bacterium]